MLGLMMTLVFMMALEDLPTEPSRANALQQARQEKASHLQKPARGFLERGLQQFEERRVIERFYEGFHGFHPLLGGIRSGSGFGGGTYVEREGIRAAGQVSVKGYQKYELSMVAPPFVNDLMFADFRATHRDLPQERFFGIGTNSRQEDETSFRLKDTNYVGRLGFTPAKHVKIGALAGWLQASAGSGTYRQSPSIEQVFDSAGAPGILAQPNYLQAGAFLEADLRDEPGNPRSGGRYTASWTSFQDQNFGDYDFGQYDIEAQQYFPFFNQRRVIVVRAKTTLTQTASEVPFFMQPTLGGSEDLRGYNEYRFRDRNMVVLNAEYRWEAFSGLDLAAFADAGGVAAKASDLRLTDLHTSYGAGLRFNTAKSVFLRLDLGFSKEGRRRLFIKFGHAF
jgi:outer membrane protein assembly factor BamA